MNDPDDLMARTRAAVGYVNTTREGSEGPIAMSAFLSLFHPEMSEEKRRELINSQRR